MIRRGFVVASLRAFGALSAFSAFSATTALAQQAPPALRVCLPEDSAPYSAIDHGRGAGLDHDLMKAIATRLGRPFEPIWFESRFDKEGNDALDARALLAANACDLVAGFPLYGPNLQPDGVTRARTPDYAGALPLRQRPYQDLVPVNAGGAYRATALVLVPAKAEDQQVSSLASLAGRRVAVTAGSMASLALTAYRGGVLADSLRGFNTRQDVMSSLEQQSADFALVDVAVWDRYRASHAGSALAPTAFRYPISINIGVLVRASDAQLLRAVESVLTEASDGGELAAIAARNQATWVTPELPLLLPSLSLKDFVAAGR